MNIKPLCETPSAQPMAYACGECSAIFLAANKDVAESCCAPTCCRVCGVETQKPYTVCDRHLELSRISKAKIIAAKDFDCDAVYSDRVDGEWGGGYSSGIQEALESCEWSDSKPPAYVFGCHPTIFQIDPLVVVENQMYNHHEDAIEQVVDFEDLTEFLKQWNAKQTLVSYHPDYSQIVVIDQERFAALTKDQSNG